MTTGYHREVRHLTVLVWALLGAYVFLTLVVIDTFTKQADYQQQEIRNLVRYNEYVIKQDASDKKGLILKINDLRAEIMLSAFKGHKKLKGKSNGN